MKARVRIGGATFDPATLNIVYKAFDISWERIAPATSNKPSAIEAASMKPAETVISAARNLEEFDANGLAEIALGWEPRRHMHGQNRLTVVPYGTARSSHGPNIPATELIRFRVP